jgi:hypothetical protein
MFSFIIGVVVGLVATWTFVPKPKWLTSVASSVEAETGVDVSNTTDKK